MSYLSDLLGTAYKEGMTEEEISAALETAKVGAAPKPAAAPDSEIEKLKKRLSDVNSEAAGYKKQLRALQGAEEAAAAEQKEAMSRLESENAQLKRSIALANRKASLIGQGYDEALADATATAMVDGDMDTVLKNMAARQEALTKELRADSLRSTPRPPAGSASAGVDYAKKIDEAREANDYTAMAYYTRLQGQAAQETS